MLSVNYDLYFDFAIVSVENRDSLKQLEPKRAFAFNDIRFRVGNLADGSKFQKCQLLFFQ
jgi:hypothetical protein